MPPDGDREVMVVVGQEGVEIAIEEPQLSTTIEVIWMEPLAKELVTDEVAFVTFETST